VGVASEYVSAALSVARRLATTLIRALKICVLPVTAYEEICSSPDFLGPLFLIALCALISLAQYDVVFSRVVEVEGGELVRMVTVMDVAHVLLAWRVFSMIMVWILLFVLLWVLSKVLGGDVDSYTLFSAIGYVFVVQLMLSIVDLAYTAVVMSSMPNVVVTPMRELKRELQAGLGLDLLFNLHREWLGPKRVYHWFFNLWSMVLYAVIARTASKLSWPKAAVAGFAAHLITMLASVLIGL